MLYGAPPFVIPFERSIVHTHLLPLRWDEWAPCFGGRREVHEEKARGFLGID
jgi:hypothetical protein